MFTPGASAAASLPLYTGGGVCYKNCANYGEMQRKAENRNERKAGDSMKKGCARCFSALSLGVLALVLAMRLSQRGTTFWEPGWQTRTQPSALAGRPAGERRGLHPALEQRRAAPMIRAGGLLRAPTGRGVKRGGTCLPAGGYLSACRALGGDMTAAMREGTLLPVYVSDGSRWCELFAYVSGMPALWSKTQERAVPPGTLWERHHGSWNWPTIIGLHPVLARGNARGQLT